MESEDEIELLPSSPVHQRKLKRLKKAVRVSEYLLSSNTLDNNDPPTPHPDSSESDSLHSDNPTDSLDLDELNVETVPAIDSNGDDNGLTAELDVSEIVKEDGLGAKKVLVFDSVAEDLGGNVEDCSMETEKGEEIGDLKAKEVENEPCIVDSFPEKKGRKKKRVDNDRGEKKVKESTSNKRKAEKERLDTLKQLRAESQRLLRETREAAFKPTPILQKPISSILDKIRQRKLEISKKSKSFIDDNGDGFAREVLLGGDPVRATLGDEADKGESEETLNCPGDMNNNLDESHTGGSDDASNCSIFESTPCAPIMGSESDHLFRAPIDDTQELYPDSQRSDAKEEALNEELDSPVEEVFEPSIPSMNLKLDSAPADDVSSDEEENDKENIDPHPHGSAELSPPSGDPVKAFVDEEAEEEDNSDNDLMRFQEEEDDDEDDSEELKNMIATEYEENPIDRETRDQLHQQWLEQQDAAGMDNLLQKLNCGSKLRDTTSIGEEEDEESNETENESDDEVEEYASQPNAARINLEKVKQMIPQMFTDKDDVYVSSDDEETEKRLAKQCLLYKTEEQATFLSPAEDEGSRDVFSLIKKLNTVPDAKRKGRTPSILETRLIVQNIDISSKSSFLNRVSNHSMPSAQKHGPKKARSFIFGRDDSNSRTSISMPEDSTDTIQTESQQPKTVRAKFKSNTQNKYDTLKSASEKSGTSLLEILRKSSMHAERCVQNNQVQQTESVFASFKLAKKPIKTEGRV